jgi:hypothetical protein
VSIGDHSEDGAKPTPYDLWIESGEDGVRYRELLREHGLLVERKPGESGNLPCGWPGRKIDDGEEEGSQSEDW